MPNPVEDLADRATELHDLRFTPAGTTSPAAFREAFLNDLGIEWDIYKQLASVANVKDCLILIRKTNQGVLHGFGHGLNVTGKTLSTKGKSSEYAPLRSNLAFFSSLAKSNVKKGSETKGGRLLWRLPDYWQAIATEQASLLDVVRGDHARLATFNNQVWPEQLFIPKVAPWSRVKAQCALTASTPPDWVALRIKPSYEAEVWTAADGRAFPAAAASADGPPPVDFVWVKVGDLGKVDADFQAAAQQLENEYKTKPPAKPDWKFTGILAPDRSIPADDPHGKVYYRLYVRTATLPQLADPTPDRQRGRWTTPDMQRLLDVFAPHLISGPATRGLPGDQGGGQANTEWRALSILGQAKVPLDERGRLAKDRREKPAEVPQDEWERQTRQQVSYYEIVADYDVFCIAPSLAAIYGKVSGAHQKSRANLAKCFPRFTSDQGLVTDFEQEVKANFNQSMSGPDWLRRLYTGVAESMLHGCEVNNLFYTEAFDELIFVLPHAWQIAQGEGGAARDSDQCPRFRFSTSAYLELLGARTWNTPAVTRGPFAWPEWEEHNSVLPAYWLPHLNLMWGTRVDEEDSQAKPLLMDLEVRGKSGSPERPLRWSDRVLIQKYLRGLLEPVCDVSDGQGIGMEAARLWYYAGVYRSIYLELGKYYDYMIHAIGDASAGVSAADIAKRQDAALAKLEHARSVLRVAVRVIREAAEALRRTPLPAMGGEGARVPAPPGSAPGAPQSSRAQPIASSVHFDPDPHVVKDLRSYVAASPADPHHPDPHWVTLLRDPNWIAPAAGTTTGKFTGRRLVEYLVRLITIWDAEVEWVQLDWGHHDLEQQVGGHPAAADAAQTSALPEVSHAPAADRVVQAPRPPERPPGESFLPRLGRPGSTAQRPPRTVQSPNIASQEGAP